MKEMFKTLKHSHSVILHYQTVHGSVHHVEYTLLESFIITMYVYIIRYAGCYTYASSTCKSHLIVHVAIVMYIRCDIRDVITNKMGVNVKNVQC